MDMWYWIVKQEVLKNGLWVSTVWIGLDFCFKNEWSPTTHCGPPPLIFETKVFPKKGVWRELDIDRYHTEKEAIIGHTRMVKKWSKKMKTIQRKRTQRKTS